jgi:hypothetical protein
MPNHYVLTENPLFVQHRQLSASQPSSSVTFEVLDCSFVRLGRLTRTEGSKIAPPTGLGILPA